MNTTLVLANAIALAILVGFNFSLEKGAPIAQRMPHYLQVQKTPQLAVLSNQSVELRIASSPEPEPEQTLSAHASDRLVF